MRYVIMADGQGTRWNNYNNIPKHLIVINGETLLQHTVRLILERKPDAEVIITSHDERYEIPGARRHEPQDNHYEIDRFTYELVEDNTCFLYGDTYYTEEAMDIILGRSTDQILFFGNRKSIVAVKAADGALLQKHIDTVKRMYLNGEISTCKGWQVYQSFEGLEIDGERIIGEDYVLLDMETTDFNSPDDYEGYKRGKQDG